MRAPRLRKTAVHRWLARLYDGQTPACFRISIFLFGSFFPLPANGYRPVRSLAANKLACTFHILSDGVARARGSCGLCGLHYSLLGKLPSLFQRYVCLFSYLACGFVMRLGRGLFLSVHSLFPQCFLTILTVGMERMIRGCVYALRIGACGDHCV